MTDDVRSILADYGEPESIIIQGSYYENPKVIFNYWGRSAVFDRSGTFVRDP